MHYGAGLHREIAPALPAAEGLHDQAHVVHEADGVEQFITSLYFDNNLLDDDVAETYELRINLEGGTGCTDTEHNNLNTAITFTEDDLTQSGTGDLLHSTQASIGGDDCEDGTYYMEVQVWDTTGNDRTLILHTDDEFEYALADSE